MATSHTRPTRSKDWRLRVSTAPPPEESESENAGADKSPSSGSEGDYEIRKNPPPSSSDDGMDAYPPMPPANVVIDPPSTPEEGDEPLSPRTRRFFGLSASPTPIPNEYVSSEASPS